MPSSELGTNTANMIPQWLWYPVAGLYKAETCQQPFVNQKVTHGVVILPVKLLSTNGICRKDNHVLRILPNNKPPDSNEQFQTHGHTGPQFLPLSRLRHTNPMFKSCLGKLLKPYLKYLQSGEKVGRCGLAKSTAFLLLAQSPGVPAFVLLNK